MNGGRPVKCLAQGHNKRTFRLVLFNLPFNAERQAGKLSWYGSTREMNPKSTSCEADALSTAPLRQQKQRQLKILEERRK